MMQNFPIGTIRGPYTCGKGNDYKGGVQYAVKGPKGRIYFIEAKRDIHKAKENAERYANSIKKD